jgi:hypothetical protein
MDPLEFARLYGPWLLLLLLNFKGILNWLLALVGKIWPTFAKARETAREGEQERERRQWESRERERIDTVLALKDMLLEYRKVLDDTNLERRQLQNRLYELVERYERHDAQFVDVIQDLTDIVRGLSEKVNLVARWVTDAPSGRNDTRISA